MTGSKLDPFQRLALATTAATYLLIAVGGLVRAAGAGLGCPDWPRCFDRWIPPLDAADVPPHIDPALFNVAKAWTEYVNRLIGVAVGFLIFATLVLAIRRYRGSPRVLIPTVLAFVLVGFEGWLGGQVVASQLAPLVLTAHLVFALVIVSLLLYATVSAFFPGGRPLDVLTPERRLLGRLTLGVMGVCLVQIGLGALVRGEVQLASRGPELARAEWLGQVGAIFGVHRSFALAATLAVIALVYYVHARREHDRWLTGSAHVALALIVLQSAAGYGLAGLALPPVLQVLHLWLGSLLLGALTVLGLLAYRLDPRAAPPGGPERVDTRAPS